jgi:hypothetical protein
MMKSMIVLNDSCHLLSALLDTDGWVLDARLALVDVQSAPPIHHVALVCQETLSLTDVAELAHVTQVLTTVILMIVILVVMVFTGMVTVVNLVELTIVKNAKKKVFAQDASVTSQKDRVAAHVRDFSLQMTVVVSFVKVINTFQQVIVMIAQQIVQHVVHLLELASPVSTPRLI